MKSLRVRGGSGLGDSLYVRPIVQHLLHRGQRVTVATDYPGVFSGLDVNLERFNRTNMDIVAHYVTGKADPRTTQWQDICRSARLDVPLRFEWSVLNASLIADLRQRAGDRPVVLVHGGRAPMGRTDGFAHELLPCQRAFEAVLGALSDCFLVGIGNARPLYRLPVHTDLNGGTSVADLMDLASACDGLVAQCSFAVPLAEGFDKPLLAVWSAGGLTSGTPYISQITPQKVLSKPTSRFVVDEWTPDGIACATLAWKPERSLCAS